MANYQNYTKGTYTESDRLKNLNSQADYWNKQQLQDFTFRDFDYSDRTKGLQTQLANLGDFNFSKQQDWDKVLSDLKNMKDFSYDVNGDALYQQYKDQYTTQGKLAMQDTMGQAAAMTGGYGNSYAQSVGQQAYQGYLSQLNNVIPELYQLALSKYNSDRDDLYRRNDLYQSLHDSEYGKYSDNRDYLTDSMYRSEASDMDLYNTQYKKAYDENESRNSNIVNNRSYYTGAASDLANQEWDQYVDNESLAAKAIEIANDNAYKQNQYNFEALEDQLATKYSGYINPDDIEVDENGNVMSIKGYTIAGAGSSSSSPVGTVSGFRTDSGDNFKVTVDGKSYTVENKGELGDSELKAELDKTDTKNGEVVTYRGNMYAKYEDKYYKVGATGGLFNWWDTKGYENAYSALNPEKDD